MIGFFNKILTGVRGRINFIRQYSRFKKLSASDGRFQISFRDRYSIFYEDFAEASFDRHYVYHTSWAARKLATQRPAIHYDISSSLFFAGIASAFVPIKFYDFRVPNLQLPRLEVSTADLCRLPFETNSIESLSCMHAIEHVGLGRYGDPLDPLGDKKAITELKRVSRVGGRLLIVVPVGRPKIQFNAHRVYSYQQVIAEFDGFKLNEFSLIQNAHDGKFIENATREQADEEVYGCGCFEFIKTGKSQNG